MTYPETMEYFRQIASRGSVLGLDKIRALLGVLGDPQEQVPSVHIAGTNGKGSAGAMLAAALAADGRKVGRYVSPAVFGEREILQVLPAGGGEARWVSEEAYAGLASAVREADETAGIGATGFEIQTAMAFLYFLREDCDIALVEVGMGGRLDATNVIRHPRLCLFTHISRDHMQFLGESIAEIAAEKAGILKPGVRAVSAPQEAEAAGVLRSRSEELSCELVMVSGEKIRQVETSADEEGLHTRMVYDGQMYELALAGVHQAENAAAVIEAARALGVPDAAVREGLKHAAWPGRLELVRRKPPVILDGAHNEDAAGRLVENLGRYYPGREAIFCMGAFRDKEVRKELGILRERGRRLIAFTTSSPRAMEAEDLCELAREAGFAAETAAGPLAAVHEAIRAAGEKDIVVCCGSLSFLGEIRQGLLAEEDLQCYNHGNPQELRRYDRNTGGDQIGS
ncbi:MAG: bifunctional folylpolyglutamate synthase/dihydrofolate synthase [Lachnospiraceae bacterium]|nr:bifunctional folylpolyglutamate synthase/dihydrofolate synthase [Lachnospiraceae bacterium]